MTISLQGITPFSSANFDDFAKSPISALRAIFEESHVRLSTLNSSKIARALILNFFQSRLITTFYRSINFLRAMDKLRHKKNAAPRVWVALCLLHNSIFMVIYCRKRYHNK
ncbi:MAG: hypothetical protein ACQEQN_10690, partial [Thermodesulfobacteriota bacterium]